MPMKKHFSRANTTGTMSPISGRTAPWNNEGFIEPTNFQAQGEFGYRNYQYNLPEVYTGHPNRIERYNQYEAMDIDAEVNSCLDILAEFCTQLNGQNNTPFSIEFREDPTKHEVELLKKQLQQWCSINEFNTRIFKIFRNVLKYGDQVFVRDPENFKLYWVDMLKVIKVIVNESKGKEPEQYVLKDLNINLENLTVAQKTSTDFATNPITGMGGTGGGAPATSYTVPSMPYNTTGSRFNTNISESAIDAKHIVHLSLTEGLDRFWPFGISILETIFKVYKQKELLEDAVLIYRVSRAPERRVFKIDVGNMPTHMAMAFVERVKNEIHQRRIPSLNGGQGMVDATYNPLSINEDYFFPITADARGSSVEMLQGGCFSMDTKVSLLDGRELSIRDISEEMSTGKKLWTYSCEPLTGKVVPGLITWAGVTQKSAKVLKITLDNGKHIICTPEHKFPSYDKQFKRADEFKVGDSMIPLYRRNHKIANGHNDYEQYFDNSVKEWMFTHRAIADYLKDSEVKYKVYDVDYSSGNYEVRHHVDHNRFNNDPSNLVWMGWADHRKYHYDYGFTEEQQKSGTIAASKKLENMKNNDPVAYAEFVNKISNRMREYWENLSEEEKNIIAEKRQQSITNYFNSLSEEERQKRAEHSRKAFRKGSQVFNELMNSDSEFYRSVVDKRMEYWTDENRQQRAEVIREWNYKNWNSEKGKERKEKHSRNQQIEFTHDMLKFVIGMVKGKTTHEVTAEHVADALNKSPLRDELVVLNKDKNIRNWDVDEGFTAGNIRRSLVQQFGYKSWKDFRVKESLHNHTVVSVEWLDDPIEVGTLTIDGDEIYHDYHTFALSVGVFTKNSNLGEIDDLKYFNNKMARGLRVPSSYLPTGPDDSERTMNDGRLGTALIQEFRFNQYCERLQNYLADKFDQEFKLFLRWRGFNIDSGLFRISFNAPQNFAAYRQTELDTARVNAFSTVEAYPYISKRFALKRFLGLTEEELQENDKAWREENDKAGDIEPEGGDLRSIGISTSDLEGDLEAGEQAEGMEGMDLNMPPGPELAPPVGEMPPPPPGAAPPSAPPAPPV